MRHARTHMSRLQCGPQCANDLKRKADGSECLEGCYFTDMYIHTSLGACLGSIDAIVATHSERSTEQNLLYEKTRVGCYGWYAYIAKTVRLLAIYLGGFTVPAVFSAIHSRIRTLWAACLRERIRDTRSAHIYCLESRSPNFKR